MSKKFGTGQKDEFYFSETSKGKGLLKERILELGNILKNSVDEKIIIFYSNKFEKINLFEFMLNSHDRDYLLELENKELKKVKVFKIYKYFNHTIYILNGHLSYISEVEVNNIIKIINKVY